MYRGAVAAAALAVAGALWPAAVDAQITIDGSLRPGTAGPLTGPAFVISDGVGRQVGNNLFHSFGQFNVGPLESATFTGPMSTSNVIGRVTGGQLSSINGLIDTRSAMPSANFFLLNPAGVMLGSGAALNIGGAFHFTTADYVCLGSPGCLNDSAAGKFFANPNAASVLTVAPPAAFGFLRSPTGSIVVDGSVLAADPGQTMSFVGGPIQVKPGAVLSAPGGRVNLVSVSSAGEIPIPSFDVRGVPALGTIMVTGAFIDVSGDPSGSVSIRGGNLVIDSSVIQAATGDANGAPVAIDLAAMDALTVTNGSALFSVTGGAGRAGDISLSGGNGITVTNTSVLFSVTGGPGRGGDIRLNGGNVEITGGSVLQSIRAGDGPGGDIVVTGDTVRVAGASAVGSSNSAEGAARNGVVSITATGAMVITEASSLQSNADAGDGAPVTVTAGSLIMDQGALIKSTATTGRGGDVVVIAPQLTLQSGAQIASTVSGPGRGADLHVRSTGTTTISGEFTGINTASFCDGCVPGSGQSVAGDIFASFSALTLTDRATMQSGNIFGFQAGNVSVVATGPITISNLAGIASQAFTGDAGSVTISAPQIFIDHGFISTATLGSGRAGDVKISGGSLDLTNGGQIVTASLLPATGAGGDVNINLGTALTISGSSPTGGSSLPPVFATVFTDSRSGIFSTAQSEAPGGNITIGSPQIQLLDGGTISASSTGEFLGSGPAGHINVTAGSIMITGSSSGFFSTTAGTGPGGNITLGAAKLQLADGGTISSSSASITPGALPASGPAGQIDVTASESITITGASPTGASGLFSTTAETGPGGNITLRAPQIQLADGGKISAASTGVLQGSGPAGQIDVTAGESITITGASPTGASGLFTTTADTGPGGNITLRAPQIQLADGGTISASSTGLLPGSGAAGRIDVTGTGSITITGVPSGIFTTTAGTGAGGSITLRAPRIRLADGGTISASSTGGPSAIAGNITINFDDRFSLNGASITTDSLLADGGNITITSTGSMLDLINSQITTSVQSGVGGGGNITLGTVDHPIGFVVLKDSGIHANAFGGPGGNVNIFANVLLSSTPILTAITASSALSTPGFISINAVATDVTSSLPELKADTREAAVLLRASCAARLAEGKTSSLVVAGREGVPLEPGGLMPSTLMEPRRVAELGSVGAFLTKEWPGLRLAYLDAACGR